MHGKRKKKEKKNTKEYDLELVWDLFPLLFRRIHSSWIMSTSMEEKERPVWRILCPKRKKKRNNIIMFSYITSQYTDSVLDVPNLFAPLHHPLIQQSPNPLILDDSNGMFSEGHVHLSRYCDDCKNIIVCQST